MNYMWLKIELGVLANGALRITQHKELSIFFELSEIHLVIFDNSKHISDCLIQLSVKEGEKKGTSSI